MACKCGYKGTEPKMSFDVDEAYKYLIAAGQVYTVRPDFAKKGLPKIVTIVHIHRGSEWIGRVASKWPISAGISEEELLGVLMNNPEYVWQSGFPNYQTWLNKLVKMHGKIGQWILFRCALVQ